MSEIAMSVNAENIVDCCSETEKTGIEWRNPRFQWTSKPSTNVATVRPSSRNGGQQSQPTTSFLPIGQSIELGHASPNTSNFPEENREPFRRLTVPCPFSFDARDSVRKAAYEKRMKDQREMQKRYLELVSRFTANPVRKYKPLVLTQSTRPLTVPREPFSSHDT